MAGLEESRQGIPRDRGTSYPPLLPAIVVPGAWPLAAAEKTESGQDERLGGRFPQLTLRSARRRWPTAVGSRRRCAERMLRVQEALNSLDPIDRGALALRHFEQLSRAEAAQVLGITQEAGAKRCFRAL